jgi:uncharacterized membrane protein
VSVVLAWDVAAVVYLAWVWAAVRAIDAVRARQVAASEDGSRPAAEALLLAASIASPVAVGYVLHEAGHTGSGEPIALTSFAVVSVLLAWSVSIRSSRSGTRGSTTPRRSADLGFGEDDPPDYADFAYVAFTIGMTFQVSDTSISKRPIRRAAIHHALLSYVFGTMILGIIINSIAALLGR